MNSLYQCETHPLPQLFEISIREKQAPGLPHCLNKAQLATQLGMRLLIETPSRVSNEREVFNVGIDLFLLARSFVMYPIQVTDDSVASKHRLPPPSRNHHHSTHC